MSKFSSKNVLLIKKFLIENKGVKYTKSALAAAMVGVAGKTTISSNWELVKEMKGVKTESNTDRFKKNVEVIWFDD
jgi:hypothetical protein